MDNDDLDLPAALSEALRSVPAADPAQRDAHITAALAAYDARTPSRAAITRLESRRRVLLSTAAAVLLVVGAGIGWVVHSPRATPVAADVSVSSVPSLTPAGAPPDSTVVKGGSESAAPLDGSAPNVNAASVPKCTSGELQVIDSVYLGQYVNPSDNRTIFVFRFNGRLEFIDKDTCREVELSVTAPNP